MTNEIKPTELAGEQVALRQIMEQCDTMYLLSMRNPYAWGIAEGLKRIETRDRANSHVGLVAIHAGRTFDAKDQARYEKNRELVRVLQAKGVHVDVTGQDRQFQQWKDGKATPFVRGAIVAVAWLGASRPIGDKGVARPYYMDGDMEFIPYAELPWGWYSHGRHAWPIRGAIKLAEPMPYRGNIVISKLPFADTFELKRRAGLINPEHILREQEVHVK